MFVTVIVNYSNMRNYSHVIYEKLWVVLEKHNPYTYIHTCCKLCKKLSLYHYIFVMIFFFKYDGLLHFKLFYPARCEIPIQLKEALYYNM